jgi:hypothetical protein
VDNTSLSIGIVRSSVLFSEFEDSRCNRSGWGTDIFVLRYFHSGQFRWPLTNLKTIGPSIYFQTYNSRVTLLELAKVSQLFSIRVLINLKSSYGIVWGNVPGALLRNWWLCHDLQLKLYLAIISIQASLSVVYDNRRSPSRKIWGNEAHEVATWRSVLPALIPRVCAPAHAASNGLIMRA